MKYQKGPLAELNTVFEQESTAKQLAREHALTLRQTRRGDKATYYVLENHSLKRIANGVTLTEATQIIRSYI